MRFEPTLLPGAMVIEVDARRDERGLFARTFCAEEFAAQGLTPTVAQCNLAYTYLRGSLRGLHYQAPPAAEAKLVRCTRGAIHDVIVDLRPRSATRWHHIAVRLCEENRRALYVPEGFAHGYQTLTDDAEIVYQVSHPYTPTAERGLRYDDPVLAIDWPLPVSTISEKDRYWPLLAAPAAHRR